MSERLAELDFAIDLALRAGQMMRRGRDKGLLITKKPDGTSVTNVDIAINKMVIEAVRRKRPGHAVIGEELSAGNAGEAWVVDPIDGTHNYMYGGSDAVFGIAKRTGNALQVAAVYNPFSDELFTALHGLGAYLNGKRIHVNPQATDYDFCQWPGAVPDARVLIPDLGRPLGKDSAIYQACQVAAGTSALTVFPGTAIHDIAPGALLVTEAGGTVTDRFGNTQDFSQSVLHGAVMSNGVRHAKTVAALLG